jgi:ABC-type bacteriocin/lantibiotic exporter with double-glycine peptidase domain
VLYANDNYAILSKTTNNGLTNPDLLCGPNSLYLFLILSGVSDVNYDKLSQVPNSEVGMSLSAICNAATHYKVNAEVRQYDLTDIDSLPLPAILVFHSTPTSPSPYHFSVLYKVDTHRIYLIDGTTGQKDSLLRSPRLSTWWTGIAMTEKRSVLHGVFHPWYLLSAAIVTNWMYFIWYFRRKLGIER